MWFRDVKREKKKRGKEESEKKKDRKNKKKSTRKEERDEPRQGVCTQTHQPSDIPGRVSPSPSSSSRISTSLFSLEKSGQVRLVSAKWEGVCVHDTQAQREEKNWAHGQEKKG